MDDDKLKANELFRDNMDDLEVAKGVYFSLAEAMTLVWRINQQKRTLSDDEAESIQKAIKNGMTTIKALCREKEKDEDQQ